MYCANLAKAYVTQGKYKLEASEKKVVRVDAKAKDARQRQKDQCA
jgi:hypothetical protein